jgi:murein DD-endopeptidase MepM/ murein hydrolase activator NlpD
MMTLMKTSKWELIVFSMILIASLVGACGTVTPVPTFIVTKPPSLTPIPSVTASPFPTITPTPDFCSSTQWQNEILVMSQFLFTALEPGGPSDFDRILVEQNPNWAGFEQEVEGEGLWTGGKIFASFAWGYELGTGVNPAVILVTYGVERNWEVPIDGDLISEVDRIRVTLRQYEAEWILGKVDQSQYPPIANGATYALYRYFNGDMLKLESWKSTFETVFLVSPSESLVKTMIFAQSSATVPFIQRPFAQQNFPFYHITSFFDHQYPLYSDEGIRTDLYRFDGTFFDNIPEPDECGYGSDTGSSTYCYSGHPAYDFAISDVPVKAVADGNLINCDSRWGALFIEHGNGIITSYLHMNPLVIPNEILCSDVSTERPFVEQGQVIGYASNKAPKPMGAHLHFGVGYNADISERQNIDPFGWWGDQADPWENYQNQEAQIFGRQSNWLWFGDEVGDGYLTVDNTETQAQLFNAPSAGSDWNHLNTGYQNDAWWSTLTFEPSRTAIYWGVWGVNIEQPGIYQVGAYWPSDPDSQTDPVPAKKVVYKLYYHNAQGDIQSVSLYADQSRDANQFTLLCAVPYDNQPGGCPEYPQIQFGAGPSVLILRDVSMTVI